MHKSYITCWQTDQLNLQQNMDQPFGAETGILWLKYWVVMSPVAPFTNMV